MAFCVAPSHPLAEIKEPLTVNEIAKYRAITIGDSARLLPPRAIGLAEGQDTIVVASMDSKIHFWQSGIGVGYLPTVIVQPYFEKGLLLRKEVASPLPAQPFSIAWHGDDEGEGLKWWIRNLDQPNLITRMWKSISI